MALLLFPDNTVLINFAHLHRMDLLARLAQNGAWCATVARECDQSSAWSGLEDLAQAHQIFGEPLRPETGAEHTMTRTFRTRFARPGDGPHKHLGEAETLAIMSCRSLHGIFVTDDRSVPVLATELGIMTVTTWDLLRLVARHDDVDRDTLWSYLRTLRQQDRGGPPGVTDRGSFDRWIA
ncbi:hypothetical protein [Amycolatopsis nigrescens]|uniref:hypothetical protein n=1 Tax=Amycolatopsis nigrescens TaxID=381445 RepID=UPI0003762A9B|nr:hypothetical protein [Amycolatopsis nigrescens]